MPAGSAVGAVLDLDRRGTGLGGWGVVEEFALVAVNGPPSLRDSSLAIGWPVRRMPIVPPPDVSFGETAGEALNRIVTGPGQKRFMRVLPSAEMSAAKTSRCFRSPITTRIG